MLKRIAVHVVMMLETGRVRTRRHREAPRPCARRAGARRRRPYLLERVDEAAVVQVYADGFQALPLKEKTLIWHLYQAALAGRDIFYDQRYAPSLEMRDVLEAIITHPRRGSTRRRSTRSRATRSCSGSTPARTTT